MTSLLALVVERLESIEGELRLARHERVCDMVDKDEACRMLSVSYRTLRRLVQRGELSEITEGPHHKTRYSRKDIQAYARAHTRRLA